MKKVRMKELPERFEKIEADYDINQRQGRNWLIPAKAAKSKIGESIKLLRRMCGVCVGGHLAHLAKTKVHSISFGADQFLDGIRERRSPMADDVRELRKLECNNVEIANELQNNMLKYRDYEDGIKALAWAIRKGKDFRDWCKLDENGRDWVLADEINMLLDGSCTKRRFLQNSDIDAVRDIMQRYLRDACQAPYQCFDMVEWPEDTKMSQVMRIMLQKNPQVAEIYL